jgi:cell division protein ZapA
MVSGIKRKVEVSLLGQRFTLKSDKSEEYVHGLAKFVTQQVEDLRKQTHAVSTHHLALLVALNLADQLFGREDEVREFKTGIRERTEEALKEVQNALTLLPLSDMLAAPSFHNEDLPS